MNDIDQVLKHAQLAHFDNEVTSMVVLMVVKGAPEVHLAIKSTDVFIMNGSVDMFKTEMLIMMKAATQEMKDKGMSFDDPIERIIYKALTEAGIKFTHESENKEQRLDFLLTISGVAIECKQFPSERTLKQLGEVNNVILIQGELAAHAFANMIRSKL